MLEPRGRVVEGVPEVPGDLVVALPAEGRIVGRALLHPLVGCTLFPGRLVALVTKGASLFEMRVAYQELRVDQIPLVQVFRPNWRRRSRSPLPFGGDRDYGLHHGLHGRLVPMALHAADGSGARLPNRSPQRKQTQADGQRNETNSHGTSRESRTINSTSKI